jgi:hypothetical protein
MRKEMEEVRKAFGTTDPVVIGRKIRWAAARLLLEELRKERFKFSKFQFKLMRKERDLVEIGRKLRWAAGRDLIRRISFIAR